MYVQNFLKFSNFELSKEVKTENNKNIYLKRDVQFYYDRNFKKYPKNYSKNLKYSIGMKKLNEQRKAKYKTHE